MSDDLKKGLEGVLVAESALSDIDGDVGKLVYRGYAIEDLAKGASYEEVFYLLWYGHLPDEGNSPSSPDRWWPNGPSTMLSYRRFARSPRPTRTRWLRCGPACRRCPRSTPTTATPTRTTRRPTSARPVASPPRSRPSSPRSRRIRDGQDPVEPREDLSHAANFLYMLNGEAPDDVLAETFDMALVLHADHGLNASTFSAIVTASTLSDLHSSVTSAIGTLKGAAPWRRQPGRHGDAQGGRRRPAEPLDWIKRRRSTRAAASPVPATASTT